MDDRLCGSETRPGDLNGEQHAEHTDTTFGIYLNVDDKLGKIDPKSISRIRGNLSDLKFENLNISNELIFEMVTKDI